MGRSDVEAVEEGRVAWMDVFLPFERSHFRSWAPRRIAQLKYS